MTADAAPATGVSRAQAGLSLPPDVVAEVDRVVGGMQPGTSIVVTGSIIEGFGNKHSDVDLYVLLDEGRPQQAVAIGMRPSRYVDCEYFSIAALRRLSARVASADWAGIAGLRHSEVDRYYRLAAGAPLIVTPRGAEALGLFDRQQACETLARWALLRSWECVGRGAALAHVGSHRPATLVLREAATYLGTAELATEGEGYPSVKWLGEKAARRHGRGSARFHELVDDTIRPTGGVADLLARLRRRMSAPAELAALLADGDCAVCEEVHAAEISGRRFLVHRERGLAEADEVLDPVLRRLLSGASWAVATEEAAVEFGMPAMEMRAAAWQAAEPFRNSGHLVERRQR